MTASFFLLLAAGAVAGGFVNGLAGFGTALFTLGFWLQIMSPPEAVAMVLFMSVTSGIQSMIVVWHGIRWRRLMIFLVPALLAIPIGLQLLDQIDAGTLKKIIAAFLIVFGGYFAIRKQLPNFTRPTPILDAMIGFVSGILGAIAGLSGALPTMWVSLRPWPKAEQRAVLQPFNIIILGVAGALLALDGAYSKPVLSNLLVAVPIAMLSARLGLAVFRRLDDHQFRRLLIVLMLMAGLALMTRELL